MIDFVVSVDESDENGQLKTVEKKLIIVFVL
jgi:hypothetical protein